MTLVLISLGLSLIITTFGIFSNDDDKSKPEVLEDAAKSKLKLWLEKHSLTKKNLLLFGLNMAALVVSFIMIQDEAKENVALKASIDDSKELLKSANTKLNSQQEQIFAGFEKLKKQIERQGNQTSAISGTLTSLTENIGAFSSDSKDLFNSLDRTLTVKRVAPVNKSDILIPVGQTSAVTIDSKNQIALSRELETSAYFVLNGKRYKMYPAQERLFVDENGVEQLLVYHGVKNNAHNFTIKPK
ncbi:MAG TPA: hypothetical protein VKZ97_03785 [Flavobacteriaceae bacterium]|nr:hypothetical protein [Flavobacteriaceae bacterium]